MDLKEIVKQKNALIVDVRTPQEFSGGHVAGSVNIPLQELQFRAEEIISAGKPVILCCASGARSGSAFNFLRSQGVSEIYNGGSWLDVNYLMS